MGQSAEAHEDEHVPDGLLALVAQLDADNALQVLLREERTFLVFRLACELLERVLVDPSLVQDDNASGVSAVLQIARAFLATGQKPLRTVIFAFWDGEEKGLLGSKYFVQSCPFISQVKGYLNFDMIGRNNKPEQPQHVVYFYTAAHPVFGDWLKQDIARYSLRLQPDYRAWDRPTGGSDNASFALCNIPIIWYHTDGHPDYHQPSDHTDRLNWEKMIEITKAAFLNAWNLANENKY